MGGHPAPLAPGHLALELVLELVALLDENALARQYIKATGKYTSLERRARELVDAFEHPQTRNGQGSYESMMMAGIRFRWCGYCRCYHRTVEPLEDPTT